MGVSGWIGIASFVLAACFVIYVGSLLSWSTSKILIQKKDDKQIAIVNEQSQSKSQEMDIEPSPQPAKSKKSKSPWRKVCYAALGDRWGIVGVLSFMIIIMSLMLSGCIMIWELLTDILDYFKIDHIDPAILYLTTYALYFISLIFLRYIYLFKYI